MSVSDVLEKAPPAPACVANRLQWAEYLLAAQREKTKPRVVRPFDEDGNFQNGFNFCIDCTAGYQADMAAWNRCNPATYSKEVIHETSPRPRPVKWINHL
jgi:hypothetical protein